MITLDDYMGAKEDKKQSEKRVVDFIESRKKELLSDPAVQEYLAILEVEKETKEVFDKKWQEFNLAFQNDCSHPILALEENNQETIKTSCCVCGKSFYFPDSKELDRLYSLKRLIASKTKINGKDYYLPSPYNKDEIASYYFNLQKHYTNSDLTKTLVFDYFISKLENNLPKRKIETNATTNISPHILRKIISDNNITINIH